MAPNKATASAWLSTGLELGSFFLLILCRRVVSVSLSLFSFPCSSPDLTSSVSLVAQLAKKQPKMQETTCNEGDLGLKLLKAQSWGEREEKKISVGPVGSREWKAWALRNQSLEWSGVGYPNNEGTFQKLDIFPFFSP